MTSGRPMMLHLDEVYCQFPEDEEEQTNEDGTKVHGCMSINLLFLSKRLTVYQRLEMEV